MKARILSRALGGERMAAGGRSRAIALRLLAALVLILLSFIVSAAVIAEQRARSIEDAAEDIATNAMPSVVQLAGMRSDLRLMEGLLIEHAHRVAAGRDASDLVPQILRARAAMGEKWAEEQQTPVFPGERALWVDIQAGLADVDISTQRILGAAKLDEAAAEALIYRSLRPSVDRLAEAVLVDVRFNAEQAEALAAKIGEARGRQRRIAALLDGAGALFAMMAGAAVALVLRTYMVTTDARITELDLFAARIAHDVRSPLALVAFAIDRVRNKRPAGDEDRDLLDRASRTIQRVSELVEALLTLAGVDVLHAKEARVEVRALSADAIEELAPVARANGVELELDPFDPIEVACSPGALGCVLSNLIGNAIKYMDDSPRKVVRVGASGRGARVRIDVRDSGPGVPAALRAHLWNPYVRAASSSIPGLGLGLATVRKVVEMCGGAVGLDDNPEGGSRFWVELPKAAPPRSFRDAPGP